MRYITPMVWGICLGTVSLAESNNHASPVGAVGDGVVPWGFKLGTRNIGSLIPFDFGTFLLGKDRFLETSCYQIEEYSYINQAAKNWPCFGSIPIYAGRIPIYPIVFFWLSPQHFFQTHVIAWIIIHNVFFFFQITFYSTFFGIFLVENPIPFKSRRREAKKLRRQTFGSSSFASPCSPAGSLLLPRMRGRCSKCRRVVCLGFSIFFGKSVDPKKAPTIIPWATKRARQMRRGWRCWGIQA